MFLPNFNSLIVNLISLYNHKKACDSFNPYQGPSYLKKICKIYSFFKKRTSYRKKSVNKSLYEGLFFLKKSVKIILYTYYYM